MLFKLDKQSLFMLLGSALDIVCSFLEAHWDKPGHVLLALRCLPGSDQGIVRVILLGSARRAVTVCLPHADCVLYFTTDDRLRLAHFS